MLAMTIMLQPSISITDSDVKDCNPINEVAACIASGRILQAEQIIKTAILKDSNSPILHCKLLECHARAGNKNDFRLDVGVFVKTFGITHPAWDEVKSLWSSLNNKKIQNYSTHRPIRINLLQNRRYQDPMIIEWKTLTSENAYRKLTKLKLEDQVQARLKEMYGIAEKKKMLKVLPAVIDKIKVLRYEQPNLSEIADIVISHLHGQCILGRPAKLPPILMVGAPGTGKTRFMRKIAEAINLPFCDISLAGISDSIKITGLSKFWGTADAGLIASTIAESSVGNPIFLFDEIDKAGHSEKGNPLDTLLLLLEEETSCRFKDEFIGVPMNVSFSSVLATANSIDDLPPPLLSRFIVVNVPELDMEGRITMVRSVYDELLKHKGYDDVLETDIADDVAHCFAKSPYHGRELKRAIEASALNVLTQVSVENKPKTKLHIELRHLSSYKTTNKTPTPRIGFMS
jgi:SpoVK/Ycf46/Vps4 family AAA+-type ATPase